MGKTKKTEQIVLGGGCFWCLDAAYRQLKGVESVTSGYAGGPEQDGGSQAGQPGPTYEQVTGGETGHAEVVQVAFDPTVLPLADLLDFFFALHDPTTRDRQGNDVGPQYRSIILYGSPEQEREAQAAIERAQANWQDPIVTQVRPLGTFYPAEDEHQDFFGRNPAHPYCQVVINPKLAKVREEYGGRVL